MFTPYGRHPLEIAHRYMLRTEGSGPPSPERFSQSEQNNRYSARKTRRVAAMFFSQAKAQVQNETLADSESKQTKKQQQQTAANIENN